MILDDGIILGSSYIYHLKDGRECRCSAGYSPSMGFFRLYPVNGYSNKIKMWNIIETPIEKNWNDWRHESWRVPDHRTPVYADSKVKVLGHLSKEERINLLKKLTSTCPAKLNEKKVSLGIVKPKILDWGLEEGKPYVRYSCLPLCFCGSTHHQQILDWGAYEWMRKQPEKSNQIFENYHFGEPDWNHYFLLGNSYRAPKSFMVISVIRWKNDSE